MTHYQAFNRSLLNSPLNFESDKSNLNLGIISKKKKVVFINNLYTFLKEEILKKEKHRGKYEGKRSLEVQKKKRKCFIGSEI